MPRLPQRIRPRRMKILVQRWKNLLLQSQFIDTQNKELGRLFFNEGRPYHFFDVLMDTFPTAANTAVARSSRSARISSSAVLRVLYASAQSHNGRANCCPRSGGKRLI